jgi:hypothetical protein
MLMNHRDKVWGFCNLVLWHYAVYIYNLLLGHATGGRVTPIPIISQPRYRSQALVHAETAQSTSGQVVVGYSSAHSQHQLHTKVWSQRAFKGLTASQVGVITVNLYVYEPGFDSKGQPLQVEVGH